TLVVRLQQAVDRLQELRAGVARNARRERRTEDAADDDGVRGAREEAQVLDELVERALVAEVELHVGGVVGCERNPPLPQVRGDRRDGSRAGQIAHRGDDPIPKLQRPHDLKSLLTGEITRLPPRPIPLQDEVTQSGIVVLRWPSEALEAQVQPRASERL